MYKHEPLRGSGDFARALAGLARHYHFSPESMSCTLTFENGKSIYKLFGRDSAADTFEAEGATPEQVLTLADAELGSRFKRKAQPIREDGKWLDAAPVAEARRTLQQAEEIIRLLNHPLITRQEKTKMLLIINKIDEERATQAIAKLRRAIEDREGTTAIAA